MNNLLSQRNDVFLRGGRSRRRIAVTRQDSVLPFDTRALTRRRFLDDRGWFLPMRLLSGEVPVDDLLQEHGAVLNYERYVKSHTWLEVEAAYPEGPPVCSCVICAQLEAFSDKLVTIMRDLRFKDNAPETDEPRLETLMRDLVAFAAPTREAEGAEFTKPRLLHRRQMS